MMGWRFLQVVAVGLLPWTGFGQQAPTGTPVEVRAVLHDPLHPLAELYLTDKKGGFVRLNFVAEGLSEVYSTVPVNGSVVLYDSPVPDAKHPEANVAAVAKVPGDARRLIMVVVPGGGTQRAWRMFLLDDTPAAFPAGESRVINLTPVEMAVEAGEHKLPVNPGAVTRVPAVKKVNPYNMAQTNFYFKEGEIWTVFTERQLQYLDAFRRVFLIHVTPGSTEPFVATIVDTAPSTRVPR